MQAFNMLRNICVLLVCLSISLEGKNTNPISKYQQLLAVEPENLSYQLNLAFFYLQAGDLNKAAELYQHIIASSPGHILAQYGYANVLFKQGNFSKSKKIFQLIITVNPNFTEAYYGLALVALNQKSYGEALMFFEKTALHKPVILECLYFRAYCLDKLGQEQKALRKYKEFIILCVSLKKNKIYQASLWKARSRIQFLEKRKGIAV